MNCPRCGYPITQGAATCPQCQLAFNTVPQSVWQQQQAPPPKKRPVVWMVALGIAVAVIVALAVPLVVVLVARDGSEPQAETQTTPSETAEPAPTGASTTASPTETPTVSAKKRKALMGPGDVRDLPAGLFCRDLMSRGYSYVAAVDYWRQNGQPNQMDVERNGIPCETVYSPSDVEAYWGTSQQVSPSYVGVETLPGGLFCRDLRDLGYTYGQAVDYWFISGVPDRMDEDLNGIPCETVFPIGEVSYYW